MKFEKVRRVYALANLRLLNGCFFPVLTSLQEKTFRRTLNCLFYRLLRALIGGQAYERASSGNVIQCPPAA
jgi:hypothetical protein